METLVCAIFDHYLYLHFNCFIRMHVILYLSSQGKDVSYYVQSLSKYVSGIHFTDFEKASRYTKRKK